MLNKMKSRLIFGKKMIFIVLVFMSVALLYAQSPTLWTNIRNSAYTQDDSIYVRCETANNVLETQMYYSTDNGWSVSNLNNISGVTYQSSAYFNNQSTVYIRYRSLVDTFVSMQSAYVASNEATPSYQKLGFVIDDVQGDNLVPDAECLDIQSDYFGNSDGKIYAGMQNFIHNYPSNNGGYVPTEFYFYIAGILNPETAWQDTIMYALVFANVPMMVEPGLYKIHGADFSPDAIQKIGDIDYNNNGDALVMSCDIDDLINDPDFGDWPNMSNSLAYTFFTMRTGLSGTVTIADYSKTSQQFFETYSVEPYQNHLPEITNANAITGVTNTNIAATYTDQDNNFPLYSKAIIHHSNGEENTEYDLTSAGFDYISGVNFVAQIPETDWDYIVVKFSDNDSDYSEATIYPQSADDNVITVNSHVSAFPNPINTLLSKKNTVSISYDKNYFKNPVLTIYNLKGEKITELKGNTGKIEWNIPKETLSGIYLYKLQSGNKTEINKITVIK